MIYFLTTRHEYGPYRDWLKLARLSGFEVIYFDEALAVDNKDNVYIASPSTGEWAHWKKGHLQGKLILYQLELEIDGGNSVVEVVDEVWTGDVGQARRCGYRYVPLGGHPGLNELWEPHSGGTEFNVSKTLDVSQISYQVYRRQQVTNAMIDLGLKVGTQSNLWGMERTLELLSSRVMVHVHQWEAIQAVAPLRWAIAAAHKLPVISETVLDTGIYGKTYMMHSDHEHLAPFVYMWLRPENRNRMEDYAEGLYELLCKRYCFGTMVLNNL
jgi:hypothetical protein